MIVFIDERNLVTDSYKTQLEREGFPVLTFRPSQFKQWANDTSERDFEQVGACLVGSLCADSITPKYLRECTNAPLIALSEHSSLESTLRLFDSGFDDVVKKPVHIREILARISVIRRRNKATSVDDFTSSRLRIFLDGRDPEIDGTVFELPRRERRILEFLFSIGGRRVTKGQLFDAVYGIFDEEIDENVIESHVSKLRKKLRERLGFEVIDSKRFLGYRINMEALTHKLVA
ncbi:MAG: winged helix-turn-helix domain-containing protein [Rhizobiaceae bacterium]